MQRAILVVTVLMMAGQAWSQDADGQLAGAVAEAPQPLLASAGETDAAAPLVAAALAADGAQEQTRTVPPTAYRLERV